MVEILLLILAGIAVGIFTGLLPSLPVYTGPFLIYQFHASIGIEALLIFWLAVYTGSQFFGSIACITTGIPGEESSLIYIEDIKKYTLQQRNSLLYSTALGSYIASLFATAMMWIFLNLESVVNTNWLFSLRVQTVLFVLIFLSFIFVSNKKWATLLLILFGVSISPQNNYALPEVWYSFAWFFQGHTFYMVILGMLIIPTLFDYKIDIPKQTNGYEVQREKIHWWVVIKSSVLGFVAGLIPGPSASIGSILAYKNTRDKHQKIVAAETANNSAVIASVIPFFLLALPINQNTIIMNGVMDLKGDLITEILHEASFFGLNLIDNLVLLLFVVISIYYAMSTRLIDVYVSIVVLLHKKIKLIVASIIIGLIYLDLQTAEITLAGYFTLLVVFVALGFLTKKIGISPVPMMFAILLGNKVVWGFIQLKGIYL